MLLTFWATQMAGEILYFLHRHFRLVFLVGATVGVMTLGLIFRSLLRLLFSS